MLKDNIVGWFCTVVIAAICYFAADYSFFRFQPHPQWENDALLSLIGVAVVTNVLLAWRNKKRRRPNGNWN
jgi:hypothetical protein